MLIKNEKNDSDKSGVGLGMDWQTALLHYHSKWRLTHEDDRTINKIGSEEYELSS